MTPERWALLSSASPPEFTQPNIDSRLADAVREAARETGLTASKVIGAAVAALVDGEGTTPEAATAAWLAGKLG